MFICSYTRYLKSHSWIILTNPYRCPSCTHTHKAHIRVLHTHNTHTHTHNRTRKHTHTHNTHEKKAHRKTNSISAFSTVYLKDETQNSNKQRITNLQQEELRYTKWINNISNCGSTTLLEKHHPAHQETIYKDTHCHHSVCITTRNVRATLPGGRHER